MIVVFDQELREVTGTYWTNGTRYSSIGEPTSCRSAAEDKDRFADAGSDYIAPVWDLGARRPDMIRERTARRRMIIACHG